MLFISTLVAAAIVLAVYALWFTPVGGNTLQVPADGLWRWSIQLYKEYGAIVHLRLMGDDVLILNNSCDAEELLNKRAIHYSGRKNSIYLEYRSNGKRMLLLPQGDELRSQRRAMKFMFRPDALRAYHLRQEQQARGLLNDLLLDPKNYAIALKRFSSGIIMGICYGKRVDEHDEDLKEILESNRTLNQDALPGAHLVDLFPILDHLPDFLAPWRKDARAKHLFCRLADAVRTRMRQGTASHCLIAQLWEQQSGLALDDKSVAYDTNNRM
ncbi:hypothetical protein POSPLADRAFT_1143406 [Postia placenta MAD-698-R-SB12]|uniref:Cytochrome P450 n=1 Tax=Postia placenta MAD-698-R-SB12 TaxID=670580 RepID=A0A1X6N0V4_9APHY|nr:hypothetical protein POSPLADRAFT_1143406 [Postia placenta MAD-698-R-SB12]OSX62247.1 hypothetical protein POSPLADRAFT_1143406 [Postia placenta MAD-698-R-SB12]